MDRWTPGVEEVAQIMDIGQALMKLRVAGGDTTAVEVKSARGGLPASLASTLSALANLPGGGVVVLGLDEAAGLRPVGLPDPQTLKQGLAAMARKFTPPVHLDIADALVEGESVVVATVAECDPSNKPCRVTSTGKAYLRGYDGDYELSALEEQGFLAARTAPHFDRRVVHGTSVNDLDDSLVSMWRDSVASRGRQGLGRYLDDTGELLRRGGVVGDGGELTVAGLLALGAYPQQHLPRMVVQVAVETGRSGERARNARAFDGPIPVMLEGVMEWFRANMGSTTMATDDGRVREVPDFPLPALRELVAICQNARSTPGGERIVEALATGLTVVADELSAAGLPPAAFFDVGIRFTVMLTRPPATPASAPSLGAQPPQRPRLGSALDIVLASVRAQPGQTMAEIAASTGLTVPRARRATTELRSRNLVQCDGRRGSAGRYLPVGP